MIPENLLNTAADAPRDAPTSSLRDRMRARLHNRSSLDTIKPPTPIIDGVLDVATVAMLAGKFGTYKTFVSLGWACSIATGVPWEGQEVITPGPVLYVAAEGGSGIRARVQAWEAGHNNGQRIPDDRLAVYDGRIKLTSPDEVAELGEFVNELRPVLLVLDTLHKCAPGVEENSSKDMGTVLDVVADLRERYGVTVLLDHHTGHGGERSRGSSALEDDIDTSWVIQLAGSDDDRSEKNQRTLKHRKAKDRELLADRPLILHKEETSGSAYLTTGEVPINWDNPLVKAQKLAAQLDEMGVPVSYGRDKCAQVLRDASVKFNNNVLADAVKLRKNPGDV